MKTTIDALVEALQGARTLFAHHCHKDCTLQNWLDNADAALALARAEQAEPGALIDQMVNRFLGWKLPRNFAPDGGIKFHLPSYEGFNLSECWPIGTNLFTAEQAKAMFAHCVEGSTPPAPVPQPVQVVPVAWRWIDIHEQVPERGTNCLILSQEPWEKCPSVKLDTWDEQHEAPLSWSSATIPIGEGWDNDSACVTHWMPCPPAHAAAAPPPPKREPQWQPQFDGISHKQETLVKQFCAEIAGPLGVRGGPPDPVRLLEMAEALYRAEAEDAAHGITPKEVG